MKKLIILILLALLTTSLIPANELSEILMQFETGLKKLEEGQTEVEKGIDELRMGLNESNEGLKEVEKGLQISGERVDDLQNLFNDYKTKSDLIIQEQQDQITSLELTVDLALVIGTVYTAKDAYFEGSLKPPEMAVNLTCIALLIYRHWPGT